VNQATIENLATLLPISAFLVLLILQTVAPRRELVQSGFNRLCHNLFLFVVNTVVMRALIPLTLVAVAAWGEVEQVGLFHVLNAPLWLACVVSVIALDFAIYWQHVATHKIPLLWRMHKVHHTDRDMDVTTAVRFHPLELLFSLLFKIIVVSLLGAPILAVIIFELLLFIGPAFNHSNLRIPNWLDRKLRLVIATPDVHRTHHSIHRDEQDTNYGFFIIWWDRLFNTYTAEPREGHSKMRIGLDDTETKCERVDEMLIAPFK
jgi:sterol desaturase/sphingolipid hydroxylase (fatty acid hydroxylase superfamily)